MKLEEEKKIKRLFGHILRLDLFDYFRLNSFKHFRLEYDLDIIWDLCVSKEKQKYQYNIDILNSNHLEKILFNFITRIYEDKHENFLEIIGALLYDAQKALIGLGNYPSDSFDNEIIENIETTLCSLDFDKNEVRTAFSKINPKVEKVIFGENMPMKIISSVESIDETNENTIFLVHGHDEGVKQGVARFIEKGELNVTILHEKPLKGSQHIFQRFKTHSVNSGYAVILLTPDDVGKENNSKLDLKTRARQNVVLELGYFLGLLKEDKVLAIYKDVEELPSDYKGITYLEYDGKGAWKVELGKALIAAGFKFNLNKALLE